jgi:hypothetical protein
MADERSPRRFRGESGSVLIEPYRSVVTRFGSREFVFVVVHNRIVAQARLGSTNWARTSQLPEGFPIDGGDDNERHH